MACRPEAECLTDRSLQNIPNEPDRLSTRTRPVQRANKDKSEGKDFSFHEKELSLRV